MLLWIGLHVFLFVPVIGSLAFFLGVLWGERAARKAAANAAARREADRINAGAQEARRRMDYRRQQEREEVTRERR